MDEVENHPHRLLSAEPWWGPGVLVGLYPCNLVPVLPAHCSLKKPRAKLLLWLFNAPVRFFSFFNVRYLFKSMLGPPFPSRKTHTSFLVVKDSARHILCRFWTKKDENVFFGVSEGNLLLLNPNPFPVTEGKHIMNVIIEGHGVPRWSKL